jgi:hypothetical protein
MSRELLTECIDYLTDCKELGIFGLDDIIRKIKAELAKPDPDPVAWRTNDLRPKSLFTENELIARGWGLDGIPFEELYTSPPDHKQ